MHPGDGIAHGYFRNAAMLLGGGNGCFHVAQVVERVKCTDDIDAVVDGLLDKIVHHVVRIVLVAQYVLAAKQHLQLGIGQGFPQLAQTLPGILIQKAQAGVKSCSAPAFQRIIADLVQLRADGQHFFNAHARSRLALVRVAQNCISDFNLRHDLLLSA